jgi:Holliday junction resolvasome RuvABC endonuclease subunit
MNAAATSYKGLVLAVHPTARGFGWMLFESPLAPVDWGIASSKRMSNARLAARFERLLKRYEPAVLILEEFETNTRAGRIQMLCRTMIHLAACRGMDTPVYRLNAVRTVFASVGAVTRYEIAQVIAQHLDAISHRMPRRRRAWENADPRQSLFDAAALALTYFALTDGFPPGPP